ncbi:hypothetical protein T229_07540 [Tannerella sp. oral taxon BU063 isolate Cell 5]|uniref:Uncharacterized protein n=1 Tax=Tannerella sp. oral taxon BU063 isolate Cell 5 TaxID=1410950 RepID=W2CC90_9BACT|nr:hypothetical protein T229_07540 [Tannerella sp. oral taxon BU063 isolate Cell 5]
MQRMETISTLHSLFLIVPFTTTLFFAQIV